MSPGAAVRHHRAVVFTFIVGALFCTLINTAPEVWPALTGRTGSVWTPFNSSNYRAGDLYYYGPWIRQAIRGEVPLQPPTGEPDQSVATVENVRSAPYFIGALPGVLFSDFRYVLLGDIALSALLFFSGFYAIALLLTRQASAAVGAAILAYFYSGVWQATPHNVQFLSLFGRPTTISSWFEFSSITTPARLRTLLDPNDYDYVSDAFRFVHLSLSGALLTLHLLAALAVFLRPSWPRVISLLVLSLVLAFSYPSHPLIGYLAMIGLAGAAAVGRYWRACAAIIATGVTVIVVLLALGYPELVRRGLESTPMLQSLYLSNSISIAPLSAEAILNTTLLNKYLLTALLLIALFWNPRRLRFAIAGIGAAIFVVSCATLTQPVELWQRFLARGIEIPWGGFVAAGIFQFLILAGRFLDRRGIAGVALCVVATVAVCIAPVIGFSALAARNAGNLTRFISKERWEAYRWIADNLPRRAQLATLDWDDMVFLAMYTDVSLATGHTDLSGRSSEEQLRRFVAVWKLSGRSREELKQFVAESVPALLRRGRGDIRNPPLNSAEDYSRAEFAAGLLYWPHLKKVDGIAVADESMTRTNDALTSHVLALYDDAAPLRSSEGELYLLVSFAKGDGQSLAAPEGASLIFKNVERAVLKLSPTATLGPSQ